MKQAHILLATLLFCATSASAGLQLKQASGWQEAAYMEFTGLQSSYSQYNAYVTSYDGNSWVKLDPELVRSYSSYGRVEALGLKPGSNYRLKVVPVSGTTEVTADQVISGTLTVTAFDRSGFAHTGTYASTGVGAYNNDGTLKTGAKVFYVSAKTAKTISTTVITNKNGATTACTGIQAILDAYNKGYDTTPLDFRFIGKVTASNIDYFSSTEEGIQVKGRAEDSEMNITFEGVGQDAFIYGFGFLVRNCKSVEFRNLGIATLMDDDLSLDTDNDHIWIHNLDVYYGKNTGGDHIKGDGAIDVKAQSKHVTVSYCHFWDTGKSSMCGMKQDTLENYITYHHNWFDHSDSRHARIRRMSVHMYNNYYDGNSKYGVGATNGCSVFMESNYFRACKHPMLSSMQGTDAQGEGTFSGEDGGVIKSYGNYMISSGSVIYRTSSNSTKSFDAYQAATRNEVVPASVVTVQGGTSYNNFDTNSSIMYSYTPDAVANVPSIVTGTLGAGRCQHGDLQFTFTSADDDDATENAIIRAGLENYISSFFAIIGNQNPTTPDVDPTPTPEPATGSWECYWDSDNEDWSTANYTITGSTAKDTADITLLDGTTLTLYKSLKIESATTISFTAPAACKMKIIFSAKGTKSNIKVDGVKQSATSNVLTLDLAAGAHTLTKGDAGYIFYWTLYDIQTTAIDESLNPKPETWSLKTGTQKLLHSGHIYLRKNGVLYDLSGRKL